MRCPDCQDTGYLTTGYDIGIPVRDKVAADEHVQWIHSLIACTHPRKTSRKVRGETDTTNRAVASGSEGDGLVQGTPGPETTPRGGPGVPASGGTA